MSPSYRHGREFISQVLPLLQQADGDALAAFLERYWPADQLVAMLSTTDEEVVNTTLVALALTGTTAHGPQVAQLLHADDALTAAMAEYALWSIWFRAGDPQANLDLNAAVKLIAQGRYGPALSQLTALIARCPDLAEAHNQRAIARFFLGSYRQALADYRETLRLVPYHFGAWAGLGHGHAAQGQFEEALQAYQTALQLHPRLEGLRQAIQCTRECLRRRQVNAPPSRSATAEPAKE